MAWLGPAPEAAPEVIMSKSKANTQHLVIPSSFKPFEPFLEAVRSQAQPDQRPCDICGTWLNPQGLKNHRGKGPCLKAQSILLGKVERVQDCWHLPQIPERGSAVHPDTGLVRHSVLSCLQR
jgi:hypothetical protein